LLVYENADFFASEQSSLLATIFLAVLGIKDFRSEERGEGVAQDHPENTLKVASCAVDRRLADTTHKIRRLLAYFEGSLRVGGNFPHKNKKYRYRMNQIVFYRRFLQLMLNFLDSDLDN
jgi:hypothetical protein